MFRIPFDELRVSGQVQCNRGGGPLMLSLSKHREGAFSSLLESSCGIGPQLVKYGGAAA
jgi:hypothetical protein